jgi:hypothetical protein
LSGISRTTIGHDVITRWTEARGGVPARVKGTGRHGVGLLRLFPEEGGHADAPNPITCEEFFQKFDEKQLALALAYQEATSDGQISRFNKVVSPMTPPSMGAARCRH